MKESSIPSAEGGQAVLERSEHESRQRQMCCYNREERQNAPQSGAST